VPSLEREGLFLPSSEEGLRAGTGCRCPLLGEKGFSCPPLRRGFVQGLGCKCHLLEEKGLKGRLKQCPS
jgi:hypothetical protein